LTNEPEPANQLLQAEAILRHFRWLKYGEMNELMREHQLEWRRERDLWINE